MNMGVFRFRPRSYLIALLIGLVALNVVAYRHAWWMTHFTNGGQRTASPDQMTALERVEVLIRGVTVPRPASEPVNNPHRDVALLTDDGFGLAACDISSGTNQAVVLMFHGYAVAKESLLDEADLFRQWGLRTILVDFRGSGGSDGNKTTLGWKEARDVEAAVAWARREWPSQPVILYGQSLGAAAVLRAIATGNVNPDGIILESPFDRLVTTIGNRYRAMGLPSFPFAPLLAFWGGFQHGFNAFRHNPVEYAAAVQCPSLVLGGADDPWVRPDELQRVANAMGGQTQVRMFNQTGHHGLLTNGTSDDLAMVKQWIYEVLDIIHHNSQNAHAGAGR